MFRGQVFNGIAGPDGGVGARVFEADGGIWRKEKASVEEMTGGMMNGQWAMGQGWPGSLRGAKRCSTRQPRTNNADY